MKPILMIITLGLLMGLSVCAEQTPEVVVLKPDHVFAPPGFDDNDSTQIILAGDLPSTCFKVGNVLKKIDKAKKVITLTSTGLFYDGCWCLQTLVPFLQVVDVGVLKSGQYKVLVESPEGGRFRATALPVAVSKSSQPDDFLYMPVTEASVEMTGSHGSLTLSGELSSDCMWYRETKVLYRSPNLIEVLPIADSRGECKPKTTPFKVTVELDSPWRGPTLIHIRSLNGHSVNRLVNVR